MNKVPFSAFVIDDQPFCLWDAKTRDINLETLRVIDPKYFSAMGDILKPILETEQKEYASIALRTFYSHGLETLFALICATIQAPHCINGWLLKYQNRDLYSIVRKINSYEKVRTHPVLKIESPQSWEAIAKVIFSPIQTESENLKESIILSYAKLWRSFASDFLNEISSEEYNSIKHGFRHFNGGFSIAMGPQNSIGEIVPIEKMKVVSKSDFGSTFYITEKLKKKSNFIVHRKSIGWHPENFVEALHLISNSIQNILCFLKIVNQDNTTVLEYLIPHDDFYRKPWEKDAGTLISMGLNSTINKDFTEPLTDEEILGFYNK